ncbi:transposase (plasmid) [Streptomyces sp. NBC_01320]|nr:transposase [Streptomyces sp. NBC_01320]
MLPVRAWLEGKGGQPEAYCHRQMLDAIRYLVAGGIFWRAMRSDFPAWDRVMPFSVGGVRPGWLPNSTTGCVDGSGSARAGRRNLRRGSPTRCRCGPPRPCRLPQAGTTAKDCCRAASGTS